METVHRFGFVIDLAWQLFPVSAVRHVRKEVALAAKCNSGGLHFGIR